MTARVSAPVTVASCIASFARGKVAPMLQEKELSDLSLPCPHASSEPGQTGKRCCYGRILDIVIVISRLLLA